MYIYIYNIYVIYITLLQSLVYKGAVSQTSAQIGKYYLELVKNLSKNSTTFIQLYLEIKIKRKVQNSVSLCGN